MSTARSFLEQNFNVVEVAETAGLVNIVEAVTETVLAKTGASKQRPWQMEAFRGFLSGPALRNSTWLSKRSRPRTLANAAVGSLTAELSREYPGKHVIVQRDRRHGCQG